MPVKCFEIFNYRIFTEKTFILSVATLASILSWKINQHATINTWAILSCKVSWCKIPTDLSNLDSLWLLVSTGWSSSEHNVSGSVTASLLFSHWSQTILLPAKIWFCLFCWSISKHIPCTSLKISVAQKHLVFYSNMKKTKNIYLLVLHKKEIIFKKPSWPKL